MCFAQLKVAITTSTCSEENVKNVENLLLNNKKIKKLAKNNSLDPLAQVRLK